MQRVANPMVERYRYYRDQPSGLGRSKRPVQVVGVLLVLAAVGGAGYFIGAMRPPPTVTLVTGTPSAAVVSRYDSPNEPPPNNLVLNGKVTVTDAARVAKLVTDANSLPPVPSGGYACPAGAGYYEIQFVYANGDLRTLFADRGDCRFVSLGEQPDKVVAWSMTNPRLLNDLDALFR